jgi:hypothetical protein
MCLFGDRIGEMFEPKEFDPDLDKFLDFFSDSFLGMARAAQNHAICDRRDL